MKKQFKRFRVRTVAAVVAAGFRRQAWAVEPFTVRDIRVEGLQRVEPGTVFASLPFRVGDQYNDEKGSAAIRALFDLGLFKDVRIDVNGDVLVVIVEERPTIADVDFVGTKEFDKDALKKALRDVGLAEGRPYDQALADRAEQELKRQYINRSLYDAEVVTTVTPIERNRVNLTFTVTEGEPARISEIRIVGNKAFSESTLQGLFDLDTGGWLSWYTKSRPLLARQAQCRPGDAALVLPAARLPRVPHRLDPGRDLARQAGHHDHGQHHRRRALRGLRRQAGRQLPGQGRRVQVAGARSSPGEPYNADQVTRDHQGLHRLLRHLRLRLRAGRGPARDRPRQQPRGPRRWWPSPSRRAYVRRVNVGGNNRTRDEVIRREFRQFESTWYDGDKIKLSRDRVDRLGFFKEVNVETSDVPGAPDQVDLNVNVVEKPTGSLQLGAGFSSADKLALSLRASSRKTCSARATTWAWRSTPASTTARWSFSNDRSVLHPGRHLAHHRPVPPQLRARTRTRAATTRWSTTGAGLRFGVPFSELDTVFFGAGRGAHRDPARHQHPGVPTSPMPSRSATPATSFPFTIGWARDDRDSALVPTSRPPAARCTASSGCWATPTTVRANYQYQQYVPLSKQFTFAFNGELGWGKGLGGQPFPVFKNFYSGGLGSVRGFEQGTLGPRDVTGAIDRRPAQDHPQRRAASRRSRAPATTARCACSASSTSATCTARTSRSTLRRAARLGRRRHLLDLAARARCGWRSPSPSASSLAIESSDLQFQIGTSF